MIMVVVDMGIARLFPEVLFLTLPGGVKVLYYDYV